MKQTAVIIGGGSGVGRATALKLAAKGWRVAIVGRRMETLQETVRAAGSGGSGVRPHRCDVSDPEAVSAMGQKVLEELEAVEVLVNAAGVNVPERSLEVLSLSDYHQMMDTNLNGAYYCARAFLPQMRARGSGTIVNVVSDAGKRASSLAGPAYAMSKFGLAGLTQSINAEERKNGVRACAIFPGEIDTPLLQCRPEVPDANARARMLRADDVADTILFCIGLPPRAIVEELILRPR